MADDGAGTLSRAKRLLITADGGGSNGARVRLWKLELQKLADELGLAITVCHLPPGTSKWNKIEHRLFSFITQNWRGKPLVSHQAIVQLIAARRPTQASRCAASSTPTPIRPASKSPTHEIDAVNLLRHEFHGDWNVTLAEYFKEVASSDIFDYGFGRVADFFKSKYPDRSFDWVITNPPFRLGEEFIRQSMKIARRGVAMLTRTVFIESVGRYERIFKPNPPSRFAQFTERVPMVKGRIDKKASTATGYAWLVWELGRPGNPELVWVPPCRRVLERDGDYQQAPHVKNDQKSASVIPMRKPEGKDLFEEQLSS